jgi:hypothetical protein
LFSSACASASRASLSWCARTGTLRYAIIGHTAVGLLNLSIAAFLNLYLPRAGMTR